MVYLLKQIRHYIPLFILSTFLSFAISSCDGTKHLAEGESLLVSNRIVSSDKDYNVSSLYDYIVQKPNTKWFSTLKVPLGIYTLSGRDTTKTINRILQKWGEAPVCLDTTKVAASQENLRQILFNQGFLDAGVEVEQHTRKRRVKVNYIL